MTDGFSHLDLEDLGKVRDRLRGKFMSAADRSAYALGILIDWDTEALGRCLSIWQETCARWHSNAKRETSMFGAGNTQSSGLSSIKYMSVLLWALTQTGESPVASIEMSDGPLGDIEILFHNWPNECCCFMGVYHHFHDLQAQRGVLARYDLDGPPMHYRFLRAMAYYLARPRVEAALGKRVDYEDLYLIFKGMDLIGIDTDYAPAAPAALVGVAG
jgi:hypothetical protein